MVKVLDSESMIPAAVGCVDEQLLTATTTEPPSKSNGNNNKSNKDQQQPKNSRRKPLLATYEPDKRLDSWLKVKKDYDTSSADTLDLIPIAGWHGQGRKAAWWSPILLAARNPSSGMLEAVCKCMSGFTDKFYMENRARYSWSRNEKQEQEEEEQEEGGTEEDGNVLVHGEQLPYIEYSGPTPDIWFEPSEVWEVAFADVTLSPTYPAARGLVDEDKGLSLRFPRFLKVRADKGIEEASTVEFLAELYRKQERSGIKGGEMTGAGSANGDNQEDKEMKEM